MADILPLSPPTSGAPLEMALPLFKFALGQMQDVRKRVGNHLAQLSCNQVMLWSVVLTKLNQHFKSVRWEGNPLWESHCQQFSTFAGLEAGGRYPNAREISAAMALMELEGLEVPPALKQALLQAAVA